MSTPNEDQHTFPNGIPANGLNDSIRVVDPLNGSNNSTSIHIDPSNIHGNEDDHYNDVEVPPAYTVAYTPEIHVINRTSRAHHIKHPSTKDMEPEFTMDNDQINFSDMRKSIISENSRIQHHRQNHQHTEVLHAKNSLLRLPPEIMLQMFHHLDRKDLFSLLTVCREIADLIIEILWFRPNMQNDSSYKKIKQIMERPRDSTFWNYRLFIKRLNLSFMTKLVDHDLLSLFIGCPKLERLTLVNCTKLTHSPITEVLKGCERLQSIDLTGVTDIQDDIINALAVNCTRLQGLYAPSCGYVSEEAIVNLLESCPMLKRIKFNNSNNITDTSILKMYENCKSLVEIDLHNCPNVSDLHLKSIFLDLSQLREFRISNAAGVTDKLFELLPNEYYLEKLRIIDITGCNAITDKLVEKLVLCAPKLRNVVLSKCMQITDGSLRALSQLGRSLHYVHLGHCGLITDFGVASLVRSCHRIQYIDLACCSQLTDWTLVELANLPKLRRIGLVKCSLITDSGILELVRRRGDHDCLERVHLSYCTNLTIGPIFMLLKSCPKLTHLSLTGITSFLRREITRFCRDPPPDFNENQRNLFCVFSGNGVNHLRSHLISMMDERTYQIDQGDQQALFHERRRRLIDAGFQAGDIDQQQQLHQRQDQQPVLGEGNQRQPQLQQDQQQDQPEQQQEQQLQQRQNAQGQLVQPGWERRGLGLMQQQDILPDPEMQNINREIFRELNGGNRNPADMRAYFQQLIRDRHNERIGGERQVNEFEIQAEQRAQRLAQQHLQQNPQNDQNPQNAPHIVQPAVFPNALQGVPMIDDDDDVEMIDAGLFPRRGQ